MIDLTVIFKRLLSVTDTVDIDSDFATFEGLTLRDVELIQSGVTEKFFEPLTGALVGFEPAFEEEFVVPLFEL